MTILHAPEYEAMLDEVTVTMTWRSKGNDSGSHTLSFGKDQGTLAIKNYLRQSVIATMHLASQVSEDSLSRRGE